MGHKGWVTSVAFSPDGRLAASGARDRKVRLLEVDTGKELRTIDLGEGHFMFQGVAVSFLTGRYVAAGASGGLAVWEVDTGRPAGGISDPNGRMVTVAFSRDGTRAVSVADNRTIKLWDLTTGKELRTFTEALARRAIDQERLQDWVANRIKARRAIILLDTCESGALVSGYTKSRTDVPASEAAVGRLHEATGRPVLTAAASGKPAFEGYRGHGVFTYAAMDALRHGDISGNGVSRSPSWWRTCRTACRGSARSWTAEASP